jgi:hypothetical protein
MGFDILLIGVILLANPFHAATDLIAAVIIAVAVKRAEKMLRDFRKVRLFSYGLIAIGVLEFSFRYIFPIQIVLGISEIWRWGLLIPIETYLISGIMDFAMINENAAIYKRAENLKKPIYISCAIAACIEAASVIWSEFAVASLIWKLAAAVVTAMLSAIIFHCNKEITIKKVQTGNEENTEEKS